MSGISDAIKYRGAAKSAIIDGKAQVEASKRHAEELETKSRSDTHLVSRNMKTLRQNQTAEASSVFAEQAGMSGLTSGGSQRMSNISVADRWEEAIQNMNLSNAISDSNLRHQAKLSLYNGNVAMQQAHQTAKAYKDLSNEAIGRAIIEGAAAVAGGVSGGISAPAGQTFSGIASGAMDGFNLAGSILNLAGNPVEKDRVAQGNKLIANWLQQNYGSPLKK